jgi:hypothetical protein
MGRKDSGDDVSVRIGDVLAAFGFPVDSKISGLSVKEGENNEGKVKGMDGSVEG